MPLRTRDHATGAIALAVGSGRSPYGPEEVGLARDLAGRAAIAIDNARLYRDVQENDRRKNEFLAMLAHELRNPLAPIRNAVEILRMLDIPDPNLHWANDIITRQVEQLVRLVDDLLDISRITGGKIQLRKEAVDVAVAVARAVETSRPLIDARRHELSVSLPTAPVHVAADLVRLSQVLSNLLNNAAKYTEEGGRIRLEVARESDEVVFRVQDNGIGISPDMVPCIFDLFIQVDRSIDRSQGGLGVGLTLVRQLVEMHGGSVQAFSEGPNRGSEFVVRLPALVLPADDDASAGRDIPQDEPVSPRRILIIEDYPAVAESLRRMLHMGGHEVRVSRDGHGAMEELAVAAPGPHPPRHRPAGHGRLRGGPLHPPTAGQRIHRARRADRPRPGGGSSAIGRGRLQSPPDKAGGPGRPVLLDLHRPATRYRAVDARLHPVPRLSSLADRGCVDVPGRQPVRILERMGNAPCRWKMRS